MTLFKCQMYLARTAKIGDTFQIELEFRNVEICVSRDCLKTVLVVLQSCLIAKK